MVAVWLCVIDKGYHTHLQSKGEIVIDDLMICDDEVCPWAAELERASVW